MGRSRFFSNKKNLTNTLNLINEKKTFFILVFANLIFQLGITYYIMEKNNKTMNIWYLFFAELLIILILAFVPMPEFIKFMLFCLFSYIFGLMLSSLKKVYSPQIINVAIQGAMSVFGIMMALGVLLILSGIRLGYKTGLILFFALLLLIIFELVFVLGAGMTVAQKALSFFGIILFAGYVVYDTNIILQRDYLGDFITASLDYYLDILNLFTNFLVNDY